MKWTFIGTIPIYELGVQASALKGRDQWEWIGLWKVAIVQHLVRIVVINIHFYFNLAAILEQFYFHFRLLQQIE